MCKFWRRRRRCSSATREATFARCELKLQSKERRNVESGRRWRWRQLEGTVSLKSCLVNLYREVGRCISRAINAREDELYPWISAWLSKIKEGE